MKAGVRRFYGGAMSRPAEPRTPARPAGGAEVLVECVSKSYGRGVVALQDVSLEIAPNEFVSLTGPPGSGKSTLLNLIAGFSRPDLGSISVAGLSPWAVRERGVYRREVIGFVFQLHRLLPALSACGNVEVALVWRRRRRPGAHQPACRYRAWHGPAILPKR